MSFSATAVGDKWSICTILMVNMSAKAIVLFFQAVSIYLRKHYEMQMSRLDLANSRKHSQLVFIVARLNTL